MTETPANALPAAADHAADIQFVDYKDLEQRRILGSRTQLMRLQRAQGFPMPLHIGGRAVWPLAEIRAWLEARVLSGRTPIFACADPDEIRKRMTNPKGDK